jgi:hypothetical protein
MTRRVLGVSLSRRKNGKTEIPGFRPVSDVLEIGPEWRRLRRDGVFGDAGGETARETENLGSWGGESGRGRCAAREIPGVGRVVRQNFSFSVFQRADTQIPGSGVSYVPRLCENSRLDSKIHLSIEGSIHERIY